MKVKCKTLTKKKEGSKIKNNEHKLREDDKNEGHSNSVL